MEDTKMSVLGDVERDDRQQHVVCFHFCVIERERERRQEVGVL